MCLCSFSPLLSVLATTNVYFTINVSIIRHSLHLIRSTSLHYFVSVDDLSWASPGTFIRIIRPYNLALTIMGTKSPHLDAIMTPFNGCYVIWPCIRLNFHRRPELLLLQKFFDVKSLPVKCFLWPLPANIWRLIDFDRNINNEHISRF